MATAEATVQRTQSGYERDKLANELRHARELRKRKREEERVQETSDASDGGKVIYAADRFKKGESRGRSLLAHERPEESGFGKEDSGLDTLPESDGNPLEMEAARGGLYQADAPVGPRGQAETYGYTADEALGGGQGAALEQQSGYETALNADQQEQSAARELRAQKFAATQEASAKEGIAAKLQGGQEVLEKAPEIALQLATNVQRIQTYLFVGSLSINVAFFDLGLLTAAGWTGMGLVSFFKSRGANPLRKLIDRFSLPEPTIVFVIPIIFIYCINLLLITLAVMIIYYVTHPAEATWELLKSLVSGWFGTVFE